MNVDRGLEIKKYENDCSERTVLNSYGGTHLLSLNSKCLLSVLFLKRISLSALSLKIPNPTTSPNETMEKKWLILELTYEFLIRSRSLNNINIKDGIYYNKEFHGVLRVL